MLSSDDPMGVAAVDIRKLAPGTVAHMDLPLVPKKKEHVSGSITVQVHYTTAAQAAKSYQMAKNHYDSLLAVTTFFCLFILISQSFKAENMIIPDLLSKAHQTQELTTALMTLFEAENIFYQYAAVVIHREVAVTGIN